MVSMVLTAAGVVLAYLVWRRPYEGRAAGPTLMAQRTGGDFGPGVGGGAAPRQLPREASWFTGRATELARLLAMVPDPGRATAVVISSIDGMAGIGKTALAVYAARRMSGRFPDGQLFIDLRGFTEGVAPVRPAEALDRLLRMLGVPGERVPSELDDRAALWRSTLAGRQMLIVLDNAATEAQVAPLLPGEPGCLVLVTSRRRLVGLEATYTISLDMLPVADAVALFCATAGYARLTPRSRDLVVEAVELCGRLPLAIRIAAARVQGKPVSAVAELVARLRDQGLRLAELADPAAGGRSVTAALALSYQHLAADEQRLYRLLGLHPGPEFDPPAAAALAGCGPAEAAMRLDRLQDAHLVQAPARGRYAFHDLVRAHAAHTAVIAEPESDRLAALRRLLDYYRHAATVAMDIAHPYERRQRPLVPPSGTPAPDLTDPASALGWLDAELPNLLAAARYASEHGMTGHVWHLSTVLHRHMRTRGHYHDAETLHHQALTTALTTGDQVGERDALTSLGHIHRIQGRYGQAADYYERALRIARSIGDRAGELSVLAGLGHIRTTQGRYGQAADHYQQTLRIARTVADRAGEFEALIGLGWIHMWQGRYGQAADQYEQALQIARATGHHAGEVDALNGFGGVRRLQGRYAEATDHYERALQVARATGHRHGQLNALIGLGWILLWQGQYGQAADHHQRALQIARATGHRTGELDALNGLGGVHRRQGSHVQAADHYQQLLTFAVENGDRNYEFEARQGMGRLRHAAGHPDEAIAHHEQALALAGELGQPEDEARAHDGLAHAYHALRQPERARTHWRHALDILTDRGIDHTEDEQATVAAIRAHLADLDQRQESQRESA